MLDLKTVIKTILVITAPLALAACEVHSTITPDVGPYPVGPFDFAGDAPITANQLAGTWTSSDCRSASDNETSYTLTYEYSPFGQLAVVAPMYNGAYCQGTPLATMQFADSYSLGPLDAYVDGTTDIAYGITSTVSVRPNSNYAANDFNSTQFCGLNSWQAGVPVVLPVNAACLGGVNLPPNQTLIGISGNTLYSGNPSMTDIDPNSGMQFVSATTPDLP